MKMPLSAKSTGLVWPYIISVFTKLCDLVQHSTNIHTFLFVLHERQSLTPHLITISQWNVWQIFINLTEFVEARYAHVRKWPSHLPTGMCYMRHLYVHAPWVWSATWLHESIRTVIKPHQSNATNMDIRMCILTSDTVAPLALLICIHIYICYFVTYIF